MCLNSQNNALSIFLKNQDEARDYLAHYGNDGASLNKGVTLSYANIAKNDPLFIWFSAAVLGSDQVGKSIAFGNYPLLNHAQDVQTLALGFAWGNQAIHSNIVALYHTYKDLGLNGLKELFNHDSFVGYISQAALDAFTIFSELEIYLAEYAYNQGLPSNDLSVVSSFINQDNNLEILKKANLLLVEHEQAIVSPMYEKSFFENGRTVADVLNDVNFMESLIANGCEIAGAKILDKYIPLDSHDFNIYDNRMTYFKKVFDEYFDILSQEDGLEKLIVQRDIVAASLNVDYLEYGSHFCNTEESCIQMMALEDEIQYADFAFMKDKTQNKWRIVCDYDFPDISLCKPHGISAFSTYGHMILPYGTHIDAMLFYQEETQSLFKIVSPTHVESTPARYFNGEWGIVAWIFVEHNTKLYSDTPEFPVFPNYDIYYVWKYNISVSNSELLTELRDYYVEMPNTSIQVATADAASLLEDYQPKFNLEVKNVKTLTFQEAGSEQSVKALATEKLQDSDLATNMVDKSIIEDPISWDLNESHFILEEVSPDTFSSFIQKNTLQLEHTLIFSEDSIVESLASLIMDKEPPGMPLSHLEPGVDTKNTEELVQIEPNFLFMDIAEPIHALISEQPLLQVF